MKELLKKLIRFVFLAYPKEKVRTGEVYNPYAKIREIQKENWKVRFG